MKPIRSGWQKSIQLGFVSDLIRFEFGIFWIRSGWIKSDRIRYFAQPYSYRQTKHLFYLTNFKNILKKINTKQKRINCFLNFCLPFIFSHLLLPLPPNSLLLPPFYRLPMTFSHSYFINFVIIIIMKERKR